MWRRSLLLAAAPLMALLCMQALVLQSTEAQAGAPHCQPGEEPMFVHGLVELTNSLGAQMGEPHCQPGEEPRFVHGIAELQNRLGPTMGVPTECEHIDPTSGDTLQRTTTGLAYHRPSLSTSMFTDGSTHWALADGTVVL